MSAEIPPDTLAVLADLLSVVRTQNGNLHKDINEILARGEKVYQGLVILKVERPVRPPDPLRDAVEQTIGAWALGGSGPGPGRPIMGSDFEELSAAVTETLSRAGVGAPVVSPADAEMIDRIAGLHAYHGGSVSSGISDPALRDKLRKNPDETERLLKIYLLDMLSRPEYTFEDAAGVVSWAEQDLGLEY